MMPRSLFVSIAGGVAIVIAACGGTTGPSAPSTVVAAPAPAPAPAPVPPVAKLVVSSFAMQFEEFSQKTYWYRPQLVLTETSGQSAATITSLEFIIDGGMSTL